MTLVFNLKRSSTKSKRTHKKFPRQRLKNDYTTARNLKEWGYCKHNWNDDDYTYFNGDIKKFLKCHIGHPINKVYSKFLKRCKNIGKFNPKEEFYNFLQKKEDIAKWVGGFYLTNDILNYQEPIKKKKLESYYVTNKKKFNKLDLHTLLKTLYELHISQCLGTYYIRNEERTVYMDFTDSPVFEDTKRVTCSIPGVGYGIDLNIVDTQTGKTKYYYRVINGWLRSYRPKIYFYYLSK